ncbi:MAG: hypothetical protein Q7V88_17290 [Actinomycetota bacterium]|nr:hypothetical protein [Actinomycetota bacterium]
MSTSHRPLLITAALAALTLAACGGDSGGSPATTGTTVAPAGSTVPAASATTPPAGETLPEADPSTYVGANQVVNLAVLPDGSHPVLDIWAMRSFEYAPILLVEGLEYGQVSPEYGVPDGMSVIAVTAGDGPDAEPFAGMFSASDGKRYTHIVLFDREAEMGTGLLLEDVDAGNPNAFPEAHEGQALVQLYAYQLTLHALAEGEGFDMRLAGVDPSFQVGIEGVAGCAPQPRMTEQGFTASVLGGTQRVQFDLDPGTTTFTFHGWGTANEECADASVIPAVSVTVEAGDRAWVLLHSPDGESIEALVVPIA